MRFLQPVVVALALSLVGAEPLTVDTVLQRHAEARGGDEAWSAIASMRVEGTWEAFSEVVPMTQVWKRPAMYRFDHVLFGGPAVLAYDGVTAWMQGAALEALEPTAIDEDWKRNVIEDAAFEGSLIQHVRAGSSIVLEGTERLEGQPALKLIVTPSEGLPETWYLDAKTFLEVKRVSRTFDVFSNGRETEMETFFMDFRQVDDVVIPFHEERHFGTRYHVYEATRVVLNAEVDARLFRLPPAPDDAKQGRP